MNATHPHSCDPFEDRAMLLAKERQAEIAYVNVVRVFGLDSAEVTVAGHYLDQVRKRKLSTSGFDPSGKSRISTY